MGSKLYNPHTDSIEPFDEVIVGYEFTPTHASVDLQYYNEQGDKTSKGTRTYVGKAVINGAISLLDQALEQANSEEESDSYIRRARDMLNE